MMRLTLALAYQEIRAARVRLMLLALCLAVGVAGVSAVTSLAAQIETALAASSRVLFGGDVAVSDVRPIAGIERFLAVEGVLRHSVKNSMTAMVIEPNSGDTLLVQVTAADEHYPLLPETLRLEPPGTGMAQAEPSAEGIYVSEDLAAGWRLQAGAMLRIAGHDLRVRGFIAEDLSRGSSLFALGPAVLMGRSQAERIGLLGNTSRFRETVTFLVKGDPTAVAQKFKSLLGSQSSIRVSARSDENVGAGRIFSNMRIFLSQITLSTFLLVCLGLATCLAEMIRSRRTDTAIYRVLGASPSLPVAVVLLVVVATCGVGSVFGVILGEVVRSLVLLPRLAGLFPVDLPAFHWSQLPVLAPLWGIVVPLLAVWPLIRQLRVVSPASVLRGQESSEDSGVSIDSPEGPRSRLARRVRHLFYPGVALLVMLVPFLVFSGATPSQPWTGPAVFALNLLLFGSFRLALGFFLRRASRASGRLPLVLELAVGEISARRLTSFLVMSLIGIGLFFVTLMSLVQHDLARSLRADIEMGTKPNLFFLDVQQSQSQQMRELLLGELGASGRGRGGPSDARIADIAESPMVRGRLVSVDGRDTSLVWQEGDASERAREMRQREQNLTWRWELGPAETVVESLAQAGALWAEGGGGGDPAQVSLERRFAERIGARLGSWLVFSVSGVPLKARVTSIRDVFWQSFRPNFFVVMHPELMRGAPHQVLLSVHGSSAQQRRAIQNRVSDAFPNVSVIDATLFIERASGLARGVAQTAALLSGLLVGAALLILTGTMFATAAARFRHVAILRAMGASSSTLWRSLVLEFVLLGAASGGLGVIAAQGFAYVLVRQVFELSSAPELGPAMLIWLLGTVATCLTGVLSTRAALYKKPAILLRESPL